ncbi:12-oxophytodienoate reductase [Sphingobium nicotianae]|uniref:12-oxophytodienoate reductase n=1 Tax=Sphingobium nicotianae TaxID=2782607 RepID=A0A9X1DFQ0_9SPHN|nr:12-oxophytodienoate reductase [Sphingobium nicotianae]MBT2188688.1 12-oxophytodienoate reductase [Sphingobium nicotianae]
MTDPDLSPLFKPLALGNVTLRNRFVMPAMQIGFTENCGPSLRTIGYLRGRAEGGCGLIFSESCAPDHPSGYWQGAFCVMNGETRGRWAQLSDAVKGAGAAFAVQLWHPGGQRRPIEGFPHADAPTLSPSGLIQADREGGRAMTRDEMDDLAATFVRAAEDARAIGADGIELHCAHGYLMDQFLWAETNVRDDGYGGEAIADRARYPLAVAAAIRQAVGPDFLVSLRFSQFKEVDYGARVFRTPEELAEFGALARAAGVSMLNVSSRRFGKPEWPERDPDLGIAGWAKKLTDLPVMTIGSIGLSTDIFADLFDGEDPGLRIAADLGDLMRRFNGGEFDMVGVGRMQIANADFVNKLREGRYDALRLYNKAVDLKHLMAQVVPGAVEEHRKTAEA